jgi:purine-nucleoside phosphorylase
MNDDDLAQPLREAVDRWDALGWPRPAVALVSGSGLGVELGATAKGPLDLQYFLPFEVHGVVGHSHQVEVLQPRPDRPVLYYRGRLHSYQGYDPYQTVFPVRLAALLGVKVLVLTNAAGGLRKELAAGTLVLLRDHLNLSGLNPRLAGLARETAAELGIPLAEGVYAGLAGPSYETPAEVRMLARLGADVAGMSTVQEVIAARHMGVRCLAFSLVSNPGAGLGDGPVNHEEVLAAGQAAAADLRRLLGRLLAHDGLA